MKKDEQTLTSYWARAIFSGNGVPPEKTKSAAEMKKLISDNPEAIGYISKADLDGSVKAITVQ